MDTQEIKLSKETVTLKKSLTWGDTQKIKGVMMSAAKLSGKASKSDELGYDISGSAMIESQYVALECAIVEIKEGETTKKFSRNWMDNLSQEDGDKLMDAVEELSKK